MLYLKKITKKLHNQSKPQKLSGSYIGSAWAGIFA